MSELIKRKKRVRLVALLACAAGCTCATVSGTHAALINSAPSGVAAVRTA